MNRFVADAVTGLMLVAGGLFWWQGHAENRVAPAGPPRSPAASYVPAVLPQGDESAVGKAPPMPPEALPEDREAKRFNRYDKNRDNIITRLELMSSRTNDFKKLDRDGNNLLSFEEWAVRTSDKFAGADADRNGKLTRAEFATTAPKPGPKPKCKC